jgi:glutamate synthase domain-containing protein 1
MYYSYCNSVMEPWDGPAALAMTVVGFTASDPGWTVDDARYVGVTGSLLIAGSEAGMVP